MGTTESVRFKALNLCRLDSDITRSVTLQHLYEPSESNPILVLQQRVNRARVTAPQDQHRQRTVSSSNTKVWGQHLKLTRDAFQGHQRPHYEETSEARYFALSEIDRLSCYPHFQVIRKFVSQRRPQDPF